jgi:hypothetical protein
MRYHNPPNRLALLQGSSENWYHVFRVQFSSNYKNLKCKYTWPHNTSHLASILSHRNAGTGTKVTEQANTSEREEGTEGKKRLLEFES